MLLTVRGTHPGQFEGQIAGFGRIVPTRIKPLEFPQGDFRGSW
jgi:hypothetical protein